MRITEQNIHSFSLESLENYHAIAYKGNEVQIFANKPTKGFKKLQSIQILSDLKKMAEKSLSAQNMDKIKAIIHHIKVEKEKQQVSFKPIQKIINFISKLSNKLRGYEFKTSLQLATEMLQDEKLSIPLPPPPPPSYSQEKKRENSLDAQGSKKSLQGPQQAEKTLQEMLLDGIEERSKRRNKAAAAEQKDA
ncbi:hypothetical protein [Parachlamydia sp. AcF125]|uniref:hypothetical protein n=1 Tax=Parachlamydia sp. AcF125 TaxID=2795736 RepID=UPI001BC955E5|nr:hypothetical protein [Parachlamydia sp. AcF125]MBS4168691.1 hypothetical protein [Parachlamydia sp. AcF125]